MTEQLEDGVGRCRLTASKPVLKALVVSVQELPRKSHNSPTNLSPGIIYLWDLKSSFGMRLETRSNFDYSFKLGRYSQEGDPDGCANYGKNRTYPQHHGRGVSGVY